MFSIFCLAIHIFSHRSCRYKGLLTCRELLITKCWIKIKIKKNEDVSEKKVVGSPFTPGSVHPAVNATMHSHSCESQPWLCRLWPLLEWWPRKGVKGCRYKGYTRDPSPTVWSMRVILTEMGREMNWMIKRTGREWMVLLLGLGGDMSEWMIDAVKKFLEKMWFARFTN